MASCPNCGRQLRLKDWRQTCPACNSNLVLYDFEGRFYRDAKRSELSMASMRVLWQRLKAGMIGSKYAKLRLGVMLLPLISLLAPAALLQINLPLAGQRWNSGLLGLISLVSTPDAQAFLLAELSSPLYGGVFTLFAVLLVLAAAALLAALLILVFSLVSVINVKRFSLVNVVLCCICALAMLAALAVSIFFARADQGSAFLVAKMTGAPLLSIAVLGITAFMNGKLWQQGVPVPYAEGDEERAALYKKVKQGELRLDDLPFPVVQTAETRAREALIQQNHAERDDVQAGEGGEDA